MYTRSVIFLLITSSGIYAHPRRYKGDDASDDLNIEDKNRATNEIGKAIWNAAITIDKFGREINRELDLALEERDISENSPEKSEKAKQLLQDSKKRLDIELRRNNGLLKRLHSLGWRESIDAAPYTTTNEKHLVIKKPGVQGKLFERSAGPEYTFSDRSSDLSRPEDEEKRIELISTSREKRGSKNDADSLVLIDQVRNPGKKETGNQEEETENFGPSQNDDLKNSDRKFENENFTDSSRTGIGGDEEEPGDADVDKDTEYPEIDEPSDYDGTENSNGTIGSEVGSELLKKSEDLGEEDEAKDPEDPNTAEYSDDEEPSYDEDETENSNTAVGNEVDTDSSTKSEDVEEGDEEPENSDDKNTAEYPENEEDSHLEDEKKNSSTKVGNEVDTDSSTNSEDEEPENSDDKNTAEYPEYEEDSHLEDEMKNSDTKVVNEVDTDSSTKSEDEEPENSDDKNTAEYPENEEDSHLEDEKKNSSAKVGNEVDTDSSAKSEDVEGEVEEPENSDNANTIEYPENEDSHLEDEAKNSSTKMGNEVDTDSSTKSEDEEPENSDDKNTAEYPENEEDSHLEDEKKNSSTKVGNEVDTDSSAKSEAVEGEVEKPEDPDAEYPENEVPDYEDETEHSNSTESEVGSGLTDPEDLGEEDAEPVSNGKEYPETNELPQNKGSSNWSTTVGSEVGSGSTKPEDLREEDEEPENEDASGVGKYPEHQKSEKQPPSENPKKDLKTTVEDASNSNSSVTMEDPGKSDEDASRGSESTEDSEMSHEDDGQEYMGAGGGDEEVPEESSEQQSDEEEPNDLKKDDSDAGHLRGEKWTENGGEPKIPDRQRNDGESKKNSRKEDSEKSRETVKKKKVENDQPRNATTLDGKLLPKENKAEEETGKTNSEPDSSQKAAPEVPFTSSKESSDAAEQKPEVKLVPLPTEENASGNSTKSATGTPKLNVEGFPNKTSILLKIIKKTIILAPKIESRGAIISDLPEKPEDAIMVAPPISSNFPNEERQGKNIFNTDPGSQSTRTILEELSAQLRILLQGLLTPPSKDTKSEKLASEGTILTANKCSPDTATNPGCAPVFPETATMATPRLLPLVSMPLMPSFLPFSQTTSPLLLALWSSRSLSTPLQGQQPYDEGRMLLMVPLIIEELRKGTLSFEEKSNLAYIYGELWPLIVEESQRKSGERMNKKLLQFFAAISRPLNI
ncbi:RNA polymerase-associated protein LEO1 isoform X2 [Orussus abietinus]|uniref:RNA polymerase-associated protein LEO1 isoform X2 n=1 Tax=Orussus abietinus TaxID=222816 RepID=UPI000625511F|nr:RNA polymerase-associated protein LEO1 isoform X2 [Orussus abietinus]